ncbi:MAG TPA: hypothetical protein VEU62_14055 [Bryobacterales bacterium]|nr:hypothetical protein [Bryobacterales bacterium]
MSLAPASLLAKGDIVKVTIKGTGLATPIEIYPNVGEFSVWVGPGTSTSGPQETGRFNPFIIDWPKGVVAQPPPGLQHCEVSFYAGCRRRENCRVSDPVLVYVVSYDYDPAMRQGFVYLPGKGDAFYRRNIATIFRGLEGNWFYATSDWEEFVRPRIARARARDSNR